MSGIIKSVKSVGSGLMHFSALPGKKFSQDQFNSTFKAIIDGSGASSTNPLFVNSGEFYGNPDRHEGLKLLGNFFEENPSYADSIYLSIKAGVNAHWAPDSSPQTLDAAFTAIEKYLHPLYLARSALPKTLDMFTLARIGKEPLEDTMKILGEHQSKGHFNSLCLSEINANTLREAQSFTKIGAVEVEFSLFNSDPAHNGIFAACAETGIPAVCYSPLGQGVLVGKKQGDLTKGDMRLAFDRWSDEEAVQKNNNFVEGVLRLAEKRKLSPAQLALSWITTLSGSEFKGQTYPQLIPIPGSTNAARQLSNFDTAKLSTETLNEIDVMLSKFTRAGHRYNKVVDRFNNL